MIFIFSGLWLNLNKKYILDGFLFVVWCKKGVGKVAQKILIQILSKALAESVVQF